MEPISVGLSLTELVAAVEGRSDSTLERVSVAVKLAGTVGALTDLAVQHFVEQARLAGDSWTQIGAALGVTKQAAQQRFVRDARPWLERFTDRARAAVGSAEQEARALGHAAVGTEHLLLGLIQDSDSLASKVLGVYRLGVSGPPREALRARVLALIPHGPGAPDGPLPFTPRAKRTLVLAFHEALQLGHGHLGTEHLLLGVAREGQASFHLDDEMGGNVAARVLFEAGADVDRLRGRVVSLLRVLPAHDRD